MMHYSAAAEKEWREAAEDLRLASEEAAREHQHQRARNVQWTASESYDWMPHPAAESEKADSLGNERRFDEAEVELRYRNAMRGAWESLYHMKEVAQWRRSVERNWPDSRLETLLEIPMSLRAQKSLAENFPALPHLTKKHLRQMREKYSKRPPQALPEMLLDAHVQRQLGDRPKYNDLVRALLTALEALQNADTTELLDGMDQVLETFFHRNERLKKESGGDAAHDQADLSAGRQPAEAMEEKDLILSEEEVREEMTVGSAEFTSLASLDTSEKKNIEKMVRPRRGSARTEAERRRFVERNYGASLLTAGEEKKLTDQAARGVHRGMHVIVNDGTLTEDMSPYRREMMEEAWRENQTYLAAHHASVARAIQILLLRLKSSLTRDQEQGEVWEDHGVLEASRVWRVQALNDGKVFRRITHDEPGNVRVDLLLDASASQTNRRTQIAAQGYILARALHGVGIPFRATSFQSQQGFTILKMLHDYDEAPHPERMLRYFPDGANRDGFALRLVHTRMQHKPGEKNILIVLSDGKPFDQRILLNAASFRNVQQYRDDFAVADTAEEVRTLRREGVSVFGLFTGDEEDLASAQRIYGSSFAYIRTPERFADVVARVLQDELGRGI